MKWIKLKGLMWAKSEPSKLAPNAVAKANHVEPNKLAPNKLAPNKLAWAKSKGPVYGYSHTYIKRKYESEDKTIDLLTYGKEKEY